MLEDFLHFTWRTRRFDLKNLISCQGESIQIQQFGILNTNAGPDFLQAKIQIGDTLWAGHVEMHLKSSDWYKHKHETDSAYDNVILHVVFEHDKEVLRSSGEKIPTLELKNRVNKGIEHKYIRLIKNEKKIPCQSQFDAVENIIKRSVLDKLLVERLERRTTFIQKELEANKQDWESTLYSLLAAVFGLKVNKDAFHSLSRSLPFKVLLKHRNRLHDLEALLFGQAGLLDKDFEDDYPNQLKKDYFHFKQKYGLTPVPQSMWKFMRMRPANFPTIRLAQFAQFIFQTEHIFSKILAAENSVEIRNLFSVKVAGYWKNHFVFDKASKPTQKRLGRSFVDLIIINAVAPFLFVFSKAKDDHRFLNKSIALLDATKAEKNIITKQWSEIGLILDSAADSQASLELYQCYCLKKKCASCGIGASILKTI